MGPVTKEIAIVVRYFVESEVDNTAPHPPGMLMSHLHNTRGRFRHGYQSILFDYSDMCQHHNTRGRFDDQH